MSRLWEKGPSDPALDQRILEFTAGEDHLLDARLVPYDVRASIAHAEMLHAQELISAEDLAAIRGGLERLGADHAAGKWSIALADEDVHTALESRLVASVGAAGERVHLGRSRNDQVLAALRLYLRDATAALAVQVRAVAAALDGLAERQGSIPLPGYTHLQRAMPSSVAAWAAGFAAELRDDADGIEATKQRINKNPLGSAAGFGVPAILRLDREATRARLGFASTQPATAVQLSRGKAEAHVAFEIALLFQDLSRLATDLTLFASQEFGFVELPPEMTTGSSVMPQKRNPDVFELVRARSASAQASLVEILAIVAKLPSGYQRDLQTIKAPLFRSLDLAFAVCPLLAHTLPALRFREERTRAAIDPSMHAAEEAYRLVLDEGIPFRDAYRRVAERLR
jgi:argininosuccinate lyase